MEALDLNARARAVGATVRARFERLAERSPLVADVRGIGAMIGLELCHAVTLATASRAGRAYGNVLRILSPLVIEDADLERVLDVIERAVLELEPAGPAHA